MPARLVFSAFIVCSLAVPASAQRTPAKDPCVHRDRNESSRFLREAALDARALTYCTGNDCWSYDLKSAVTSIPTAKRIALDASPAALPTSDPRATVSDGNVTFCPTKDACKTFGYKFKFPAADTVIGTLNAEGTLGAITYAGNPMERNQPSYVLVFDLDKGKQIKQYKGNEVLLFRSSFAVDRTIYKRNGGKLGTLAVADHAMPRVAIPATELVAFVDTKGSLILQDVAKGPAKAKLKTGLADITWSSKLLVSPDGKLLHLVLDNPYEGEVLTFDIAARKLLGRAAPATCAPGTWR
ncbi:MAG: hypothetical protein M3680_34520 [Myxococcota bacterium]|nr:hypothetical protein [Myxococcota bacterium]